MTLDPRQTADSATLPFRGPAFVAAAFLVVALPAALWLSDNADDEGYLTFLLARIVGHEPLAGLFFLKTRPLISSIYALPAALGWKVFLAAHVVVSVLGVLFAGLAAQRLGGRGGVAAAVVALSPVYVHGAVAGYPNNDGFAVAVLALLLGTHPARWARVLMGAVLALGFLSRFEFAPVFAGLWLHAVVSRRDLLVGGSTLVVGLAYALVGAAYHGDFSWPLSFPPAFTEPPDYHAAFFEAQRFHAAHLGTVAMRLLAVTPLWLLPVAIRTHDLFPVARWFLAAAAVSFALVLAFPASGGVFWFPHLARHFLVWLPGVALAAAFSHALDLSGARRLLWALPAVPVAMAPWWGWRSGAAGWAFAVPVLVALVRFSTRRTSASLVVASLLALSIAAFFADAFRRDLWVQTREAIAFTEASATPPARVFTNVKGLGPGLEARGRAVEVRFLPNHSILYELQDLTNPDNGQRARVARVVEEDLYGRALWPCRLPADGPRPGDLLVWLPDERLDIVFPMRAWLRESERLWGSGSLEARRFTQKPARRAALEGLAAHVAAYPCGPTPAEVPGLDRVEPDGGGARPGAGP